jgi:hypothetical protein
MAAGLAPVIARRTPSLFCKTSRCDQEAFYSIDGVEMCYKHAFDAVSNLARYQALRKEDVYYLGRGIQGIQNVQDFWKIIQELTTLSVIL